MTTRGQVKKITNTTFTTFYNQFSDIVSPRSVVSCCLPCRRLVTRVACVCPPRSCSISWHSFSPWHNLSKLSSAHGLSKELFIVVNVVFCCFSSSAGDKREGEGEMARVVPIAWRSSFSGRRGRVARGKPWASPSPCAQGGWQGQRLVQTWLQEPWLQADVQLLVWAVRPADPPRGV